MYKSVQNFNPGCSHKIRKRAKSVLSSQDPTKSITILYNNNFSHERPHENTNKIQSTPNLVHLRFKTIGVARDLLPIVDQREQVVFQEYLHQ